MFGIRVVGSFVYCGGCEFVDFVVMLVVGVYGYIWCSDYFDYGVGLIFYWGDFV